MLAAAFASERQRSTTILPNNVPVNEEAPYNNHVVYNDENHVIEQPNNMNRLPISKEMATPKRNTTV